LTAPAETRHDPAVVEIRIDGPGRNSLSTAVMEDLLARLERAGGEPVLLTGAGGTFSAGLNLKEIAALDRPGMERYLTLLETLIERLYLHPAPTVACIEGHAIAGGCVLAACCDMRVIASDPRIRMGLNEVALGLEFPPKLFGVVRRRMAPRAQERVLLEAGLYDPQTAYSFGLVDEVTDTPRPAAEAWLERLAAHPRAAYAATKRLLREDSVRISPEAMRRFREELVPAWVAPEVKDRVRAVLKR
jgi:enoyl-CoA hydratase/carnithine racemase